VQNVRKGTEPLDSGDYPLLGDILVTDADIIEKVENGIRELSCGYSHELAKDGDKICQVKIVINHVALVRKGRAGPEARINDSADSGVDATKALLDKLEVLEKKSSKKIPQKDAVKTGKSSIVKKGIREKNMKGTPNVFSRLLGLGIRAMANDEDTTPEELAAATKELHEKTGEDSEMEEMEPKAKEDSKKRDAKCMPGVRGHEDCTDEACSYGKMEDDDTMDAEREMHHKMLDRVLDKMSGKKKDSDVEELRKLLDSFLSEEEDEPEHKEKPEAESEVDAEPEEEEEASEVIEPIEDAEEEEEGMISNDAAMNLLPLVEKSRNKSVQKAYDAALEGALADEKTFLKKFRPVVAKSKDASLISAFNGETRRVNGRTESSDASYAGFGFAAKQRPRKNDSAHNDYSELEQAYAKIRNGEEK
jgi:hypothetical protein